MLTSCPTYLTYRRRPASRGAMSTFASLSPSSVAATVLLCLQQQAQSLVRTSNSSRQKEPANDASSTLYSTGLPRDTALTLPGQPYELSKCSMLIPPSPLTLFSSPSDLVVLQIRQRSRSTHLTQSLCSTSNG